MCFYQVLRYFPWFDFFIIDPVIENGIVFDTEQNLKNAKVPVLILHARDDIIIPYQLSENVSVKNIIMFEYLAI